MRYTHMIECGRFTVYIDPENSHVQVRGDGMNVHVTTDYLFTRSGALADDEVCVSIGFDSSKVKVSDYRPVLEEASNGSS